MKLFHLLCSFSVVSASFAVDVSNLSNCVDDIKKNLALPETGKSFFVADYDQLMAALSTPNVRSELPAVYQKGVLDSFVGFLQGLGKAQFQSIFNGKSNSSSASFYQQVIPDIAEALLQNGNNYFPGATNAFQEVVSDLYDGFLSEESRRSKETGMPIKPPDYGVVAPLVKWGNPEAGPYTWPIDATRFLQLNAAIVSLPPNARLGGLLAWTTLPHETAGHDVLHADKGLIDELKNVIYSGLMKKFPTTPFLASYWSQCVDETMSDICGLLNGGPAVGMGLVGYFRGMFGGHLRNIGALPPGDTHPIDILRGFIAARVVSQMPFAGAKEWSDAIRQEVMKDLGMIYLVDIKTGARYMLPQQLAIQSAEYVADLTSSTKLQSLEGNSLNDIQNWSDADQQIVDQLAALLHQDAPLPASFRTSGYEAAHVVAAAATEGLKANADLGKLFRRMIRYLDAMHRNNNTWRKPSVAPIVGSDLPSPFAPHFVLSNTIEANEMEEKVAQ